MTHQRKRDDGTRLDGEPRENDEVIPGPANHSYDAGYRAGYEASLSTGRVWIPLAVEEFVFECAIALGRCSATFEGDDGTLIPWPTDEDLLQMLRAPVPWSLATILTELCRAMSIVPPDLVVDALQDDRGEPFRPWSSSAGDRD